MTSALTIRPFPARADCHPPLQKFSDMTPSLINDLCERYERNRDAYRSDAYNEAQARQEFINPLFKLLGWDMDNEQGYAEAYKDVVHEDAIRIGGAMKAPDYSFRIGGQRKFFLEAKKPRVSVVDQKDPAYQLRRYAWSAKLPLSILTNFSELAVYDCRYRPEIGDAPGKHRVEYFTYEKYAEKWEYLVNTFSKDAINKGSFDKYAVSMKGKRGTQEVDSEFLKEIEVWRDILAKNLKTRNKDLSIEALNFSVGRIIDRIIFLRVCEDRGIEEYGQLEGLLKGTGVYESLVKLFKRADERYNSGLFHFQREKGRGEQPDTLTPGLAVDDKILKEVVRTLYYPQSPYEFRVFPADILGQVYEQFLGKVIVKSGRTVDVEEKPEVRKAGGVYYTPTYIVDYIVKHTVGKLVDGKTPDEVSKLRVLDPACGSGSFLIGAYQYLLDWHLSFYVGADGNPPAPGKSDPSAIAGLETHNGGTSPSLGRASKPDSAIKMSSLEARPSKLKSGARAAHAAASKIYETPAGYRLTLAERKRILLNNIYGVDIDGQAVEVTKLSLLLKVLEGSNAAEVQGELSLRHHALPDLSENIKCGNSLVGPDIRKQFPDLSDEEITRINPFDWQAEFKDVFKQGGFDAVIGNPPYGAELTDSDKLYLGERYTVTQYKFDTFGFFVEIGLELLKKSGRIGMIVPNSWFDTVSYTKFRELILGFQIDSIVNLGRDVFRANIDTAVIISEKSGPGKRETHVINATDSSLQSVRIEQAVSGFLIDQLNWKNEKDVRIAVWKSPLLIKVYEKIIALSMPIDQLCEVSQGLIPYNTKEMSAKNPYISDKRVSVEWKPLLDEGRCVARYILSWNGKYVKFGPWLYTANKPKFYENEKILVQRHRNPSLARRIVATLDQSNYYFKDNLCCMVRKDNTEVSLAYCLGILNSSLLNSYYKTTFTEVSLNPTYLRQLPIRTINFKDKADKARHDKMVKLVERMLELNKKLPDVKTPNEREKLVRQIAATDREIDELVYELYGLTAEEIEIVEGRPHPPTPSP
jgi:hypothetical protein